MAKEIAKTGDTQKTKKEERRKITYYEEYSL